MKKITKAIITVLIITLLLISACTKQEEQNDSSVSENTQSSEDIDSENDVEEDVFDDSSQDDSEDQIEDSNTDDFYQIEETDESTGFHYKNIKAENAYYSFNKWGLKFKLLDKFKNFKVSAMDDDSMTIVIDEQLNAKDVVGIAGDPFGGLNSIVISPSVNPENFKQNLNNLKEAINAFDEKEIVIDGKTAYLYNFDGLGSSSYYNVDFTIGKFEYSFSFVDKGLLDSVIDNIDISDTRSVMEDYNLIPSKYFGGTKLSEQEIKENPANIIDIANYYMEIHPIAVEGSSTITVFIHNGEHLISISNLGCGPICEQELYFLKYDNGQLIDVTNTILPNYDLSTIKAEYIEKNGDFASLLVLPQHGTSIKIIDQYSRISGSSSEELMKLNWKNGKFVVDMD